MNKYNTTTIDNTLHANLLRLFFTRLSGTPISDASLSVSCVFQMIQFFHTP